ncbi:hypothetical protein DBV15_03367 [Temnothorax longispinosus]|uniref:Uncharacterized protein n=1 Tax=Temnothorax longispinosus TaxID=300112 RepID=A0A4S2JTF0_9HYME|nr:hypothetical protein DBV15_03367 [Temnothorax longispinosus]
MYTARFNKSSRLPSQRRLFQLHAATFILPTESPKSYATQKFHRYSLINSNGPFENPSPSCKYSKFLFQSDFSSRRSRVSASNTHFHSNIAAPREEGTIEVLLEMDFRTEKKPPRCSRRFVYGLKSNLEILDGPLW